MRVVTLYSQPGCCLCDEARIVLERLRAERPFQLTECDISRDERLHRAYFDRIPVVALDGEDLFDYHVDEAALRQRLGEMPAARRGRQMGPEVESGQ